MKKKLCKKNCSGMDVIIPVNEKRIINENVVMEEFDDELWLCLGNFNELVNVELSRTNYVTEFNCKIFKFETTMCNAWNRAFVSYYIHFLIGGVFRKV
jgi:hypothetical protein